MSCSTCTYFEPSSDDIGEGSVLSADYRFEDPLGYRQCRHPVLVAQALAEGRPGRTCDYYRNQSDCSYYTAPVPVVVRRSVDRTHEIRFNRLCSDKGPAKPLYEVVVKDKVITLDESLEAAETILVTDYIKANKLSEGTEVVVDICSIPVTDAEEPLKYLEELVS